MIENIHKVQLFLTSKCNLHCKYCYVMKMRSGIERMSEEVLADAMTFVSRSVPEGVTIELFGGEPLLEFGHVKWLLENYPTMSYYMPTNCTLLDEEKLEFLKKHRDFIELTLSLDGYIDTQLENRGAWPNLDIIKKALRELRSGMRLVIEDPSRMFDNIKYIASMKPTGIAVGIPLLYVNRYGYKEEFIKQKERVDQDDELRTIKITYDQITCGDRCKSGTEYVCVSPSGDIYPCTAFYLKSAFKIGNIKDGIDQSKVDEFLKATDPVKDIDVPCIAHKYFLKDKWING